MDSGQHGVHLCLRWTPCKSRVRRGGATALNSRPGWLAACDEPGASVAAIARAYDLNANLVFDAAGDRATATQRLRSVAAAGRIHTSWHQAVIGSCRRRWPERPLHEVLRPLGSREAVRAAPATVSLQLELAVPNQQLLAMPQLKPLYWAIQRHRLSKNPSTASSIASIWLDHSWKVCPPVASW